MIDLIFVEDRDLLISLLNTTGRTKSENILGKRTDTEIVPLLQAAFPP